MKVAPSPKGSILCILWICGLDLVDSFHLSRSSIAPYSCGERRPQLNLQYDPYPSLPPLRSTVDPFGMIMDPLLLESLSTVNHAASPFRTLSRGLSIWRRTLLKGRLPVLDDFSDKETYANTTTEELLWPTPKVLWNAVVQHMTEYKIPRLVHRHPELIRTILLCLLRLVNQYAQRIQDLTAPNEQDGEELVQEISMFVPWDELELESAQSETIESQSQSTSEMLVQIAAMVVAEEFKEIMPAISGMHALYSLFGSTTTDSIIMESQMGIGYQNNSFWHHTGWTVIPALQNQIGRLPALRGLVQSLGRRSTVTESDGQHHKFLQRPIDESLSGSLQAQLDPRLARDTISGLTRSNRFSEMLPSEAMGLLKMGSYAKVLRSLFYAKLLESQLLSYEISGWADVHSRLPPKKHPRYRRTPSARGGPILICLDTSHSMTAECKEWISKAVVLACVRAAHQQQRPCRLIAFGAKGSFLDAGDTLLRADAAGMRQLLDFLSYSFGGGTDVTGALKHALTLFDTASTENAPSEMSAADWLLITDGEIPNVSEDMIRQLGWLQEQSGLQLHGVLVGHSKEGKSMQALEEICTHTHDFLLDFPGQVRSQYRSSAPLSLLYLTPPKSFGNGRTVSRHRSRHTVLFGRRWNDEEDGDDLDFVSTGRRIRANGASGGMRVDLLSQNKLTISKEEGSLNLDDYVSRVESALEGISAMASKAVNDLAWNVSTLLDEQNSIGSCYRYREQFLEALNRVGENLIEREVESRLVVLGMISGEHVLFLGPPGTAKSALGRRLSMISGGTLFQRLLTRFTTPEEIFGPLSLRALENDEYKRCTEGFLPTATVAFLDEIFKANSAILNTLLTILNERQFDNGVGLREDCPIRCVIAASNELPESEELEALYDRFLLRREVLPVSDDGIVELLTSVSTPGVSPCDDTRCEAVFADSLDGIVGNLSVAADAVQMDADTAFLLRDLRAFLRDEMNVNMSDRRLLKAARLLKVVAASHGRSRVDPIDCLLLQHVAWNLPEQREAIREWLWDHVTPGSSGQYGMLLNGLRQTALTVVRRTGGDVTGIAGARDEDVLALASIRSEVSQVITLMKFQMDALSRHMELLQQSMDHLWLGPEEARISQQMLIPPTEKIWRETHRLLINAYQLELTLTPSSDAKLLLPNDIRLSVMEQLWEDVDGADDILFTDLELNMSMKEAKAKWSSYTFRRWKRERKKLGIK
jgi:MoxR-like ATPase